MDFGAFFFFGAGAGAGRSELTAKVAGKEELMLPAGAAKREARYAAGMLAAAAFFDTGRGQRRYG